jgi:hypothetical protein
VPCRCANRCHLAVDYVFSSGWPLQLNASRPQTHTGSLQTAVADLNPVRSKADSEAGIQLLAPPLPSEVRAVTNSHYHHARPAIYSSDRVAS